MKATVHYIVKTRLIRSINDGEIDFIQSIKKFEDPNPIVAREKAFTWYQNYIDVLLQGKGVIYSNDRRAREKMLSYIQPGDDDAYGRGIGVYLVLDIPIEEDFLKLPDELSESLRDKPGEELLIHGIGQFVSNSPQTFMDNLNTEMSYYKASEYETRSYERMVNFYEYDIQMAEMNEILATPFNWSGYDVSCNVLDTPEVDDQTNEVEKRDVEKYIELIQKGEDNQVEFKPSMLYYYGKNGNYSGYSNKVRHVVAKTICSFLNANGGHLIVGVQDDQTITGLNDDFSLVRPKGKDPEDYFRIEVDRLINQYFKPFASNIDTKLVTIDDKVICVFNVFPSKYRPVFINSLDGKQNEFYVRMTASSIHYLDVEVITEYCINKWGGRRVN